MIGPIGDQRSHLVYTYNMLKIDFVLSIYLCSDHGGAESTVSGAKFDESSWGAAYDASDDTDSVWDFNLIKTKVRYSSLYEREKAATTIYNMGLDIGMLVVWYSSNQYTIRMLIS